jgi:hypothetical protein
VLWLLWGRRRKTPVAFLDLWKGPALQKPAKRALQPPPIFLGLAILAMLLALLAGSRPRAFAGRGGAGKPITIIVDRGMSMSAMTGGQFRFVAAAKAASAELLHAESSATPVELLTVPSDGVQAADLSSWAARVEKDSPTALDTQAALQEIVRDRLAATSGGAVVVISDRQLGFDDPRLIQFSTAGMIDNIAIAKMAARETPSPQVMLTLRNDSDRRSASVKVTSGTLSVARTLDLPPRGGERNYFFDFAKFDTIIAASLDVKDDQPADDRAWLVREGSYPKIEPRAPVSAELRRMIDVYSHSRKPSDESQTVAVVDAEADLPGEKPAVWIPPATGPLAHGAVTAANHPVTANVNWSAFSAQVQTAGPAPRGWTPLLTMDGQVIVALRAEAARQVWVGFDSPAWAATPDFVVFWANVFTWVGAGQERFAGYPLAKFEPDWQPMELAPAMKAPAAGQWPGLYRTKEQGRMRAFNPVVDLHPHGTTQTPRWREKLADAEGSTRAGYDLSAPLLLLAIFALIASALKWKRRPLAGIHA